jgi:hypothetical protein
MVTRDARPTSPGPTYIAPEHTCDMVEQMVVKYVKDGVTVHGPPYTKAEEDDFYRRNAGGPVTVTRRADDRKGQKSQEPRPPSPARPRRS